MVSPVFTDFSVYGYHILRWFHYLAGVAWIGHLYYFNFVQGKFFAVTDAQTKSAAIRQLVPEALWWFRWGAALTWVTGLLMILQRGGESGSFVYTTSWGIWILLGGALGTLMAYNVWFVIWPAQKIVIASATAVASGGQADPSVASRAARALLASRTNTMFSVPMLFFMGAASHLPFSPSSGANLGLLSAVLAVILLLLEVNALVGKKTGPLTTVRGVITCGFILTAVLFFAVAFLV
jgi:uncharacterized membrane protein